MLVPGGGCLQKETEGGSAVWELVARRAGGRSMQILDRFSQLQIDEILDEVFFQDALVLCIAAPTSVLPGETNSREQSERGKFSSTSPQRKGD